MSGASYDIRQLLEAIVRFHDREFGGRHDIDVDNPPDTIHVCCSDDAVRINGTQVCYEIQLDFNVEKCQYECYIDDELADVRKAASYKEVIDEIDALGFDELLGKYFTYDGVPPDCVRTVLDRTSKAG